jgi:hypothetical protein
MKNKLLFVKSCQKKDDLKKEKKSIKPEGELSSEELLNLIVEQARTIDELKAEIIKLTDSFIQAESLVNSFKETQEKHLKDASGEKADTPPEQVKEDNKVSDAVNSEDAAKTSNSNESSDVKVNSKNTSNQNKKTKTVK